MIGKDDINAIRLHASMCASHHIYDHRAAVGTTYKGSSHVLLLTVMTDFTSRILSKLVLLMFGLRRLQIPFHTITCTTGRRKHVSAIIPKSDS